MPAGTCELAATGSSPLQVEFHELRESYGRMKVDRARLGERLGGIEGLRGDREGDREDLCNGGGATRSLESSPDWGRYCRGTGCSLSGLVPMEGEEESALCGQGGGGDSRSEAKATGALLPHPRTLAATEGHAELRRSTRSDCCELRCCSGEAARVKHHVDLPEDAAVIRSVANYADCQCNAHTVRAKRLESEAGELWAEAKERGVAAAQLRAEAAEAGAVVSQLRAEVGEHSDEVALLRAELATRSAELSSSNSLVLELRAALATTQADFEVEVASHRRLRRESATMQRTEEATIKNEIRAVAETRRCLRHQSRDRDAKAARLFAEEGCEAADHAAASEMSAARAEYAVFMLRDEFASSEASVSQLMEKAATAAISTAMEAQGPAMQPRRSRSPREDTREQELQRFRVEACKSLREVLASMMSSTAPSDADTTALFKKPTQLSPREMSPTSSPPCISNDMQHPWCSGPWCSGLHGTPSMLESLVASPSRRPPASLPTFAVAAVPMAVPVAAEPHVAEPLPGPRRVRARSATCYLLEPGVRSRHSAVCSSSVAAVGIGAVEESSRGAGRSIPSGRTCTTKRNLRSQPTLEFSALGPRQRTPPTLSSSLSARSMSSRRSFPSCPACPCALP